VPEAWLIDSV